MAKHPPHAVAAPTEISWLTSVCCRVVPPWSFWKRGNPICTFYVISVKIRELLWTSFWTDLLTQQLNLLQIGGATKNRTSHPLHQRQGSRAFERALICHQLKGIAVTVNDRAMAIPMVDGGWFHAPEPLKEEAKSSYYYITQRGAWTPTSTPFERHMIFLGLAPRVWTQALHWRYQEVHCCASVVAARAICEYCS